MKITIFAPLAHVLTPLIYLCSYYSLRAPRKIIVNLKKCLKLEPLLNFVNFTKFTCNSLKKVKLYIHIKVFIKQQGSILRGIFMNNIIKGFFIFSKNNLKSKVKVPK